ncbi:MAG: DNA adenine methylase [Paludibacteraceae bacterium]|nr:DNA adenine methylase [Paludibacteraceae bacterium]
MNKFVSPLRYPGGKLKVVNYIKRLMEENDLCGGTYIEPYAGGANVALSLLLSKYAKRIKINDIDRSIYAFWHSALMETENLCRMIQDTDVTLETWERQHELQKNKMEVDLLELGFSTFFLNRTNRSGILNGGVIGGKAQTGKYKIDARYNKKDLIERIEVIAAQRNKIELTSMDAVAFLKRYKRSPAEKTLCYLDPPYYVKGKDLYLNYYNDSDHQTIAETIMKYKGKWIISYDAVDFIKKLYKDYKQTEYYLSYSAGNPSKGRELMIYSDGLILPEVEVVKMKR